MPAPRSVTPRVLQDRLASLAGVLCARDDALALLALGSVGEIFGAGTLFGIHLFGPDFQPWVVMVLPPGGFFVLGAWLLLFNWWRNRKPAALQPATVARETSHG